MSRDPLASRDAGQTLLGLYGLKNETVAWLISRGWGELAALTPQQLKTGMNVPLCHSWEHEMPKRMLYRPDGWACYDHDPPIKHPHDLPLMEAPSLIDYGDGDGRVPFIGSLEELVALGSQEVDVVYSNDDDGRGTRWKYVVRS